MRYTQDGGVIPSGVPVIDREPAAHDKLFGLYRGTVVRTVYPDDPQNTTGDRMEYVVRVGRQEYPNAVNMRVGGGIYNFNERIRKEAEKSFTGKFDRSTYSENLDGETVYVLFLEGYGNTPVIIGGAQNPRQGRYEKFSKKDGRFDLEEFNGVEFLIDKDSNYTIKHVGRKSPDGAVLNPAAVDSQIKMFGNGDIELNTHGTQGTGDLRMKFTKADKKAEIYAQDDKIIMDSAGIKIEDKNSNRITQNAAGTKIEDNNGNIVEMKAGEVNITVAGKCTVNSSGETVVNASTIKLNGASGDVLTNVTDPIVDTIYGVPTVGVPTVKSG